jgi:hypothetical protein
VYVGNDGGVYVRARHRQLRALNDGLNTLQYYYADAGRLPARACGELRLHGTEYAATPEGATMVSPFGGDGGDTLCRPHDNNHAVVGTSTSTRR